MEKETPIRDRTLRLCMKVVGKAGDKTQEEVFLEFDAAVRQSDIFQEAGYKGVVIQPTHIVYDADEDKWYFAKIEGTAKINESAVPAQYSRTNINPGISVYEYERMREREQHVTVKQLIVAVMFTIAVGIAPGFYFGMSVSDGMGATATRRAIIVGGCSIITLFLMVGIHPLRYKAVAAGAQFAGIRWTDD